MKSHLSNLKSDDQPFAVLNKCRGRWGDKTISWRDLDLKLRSKEIILKNISKCYTVSRLNNWRKRLKKSLTSAWYHKSVTVPKTSLTTVPLTLKAPSYNKRKISIQNHLTRWFPNPRSRPKKIINNKNSVNMISMSYPSLFRTTWKQDSPENWNSGQEIIQQNRKF